MGNQRATKSWYMINFHEVFEGEVIDAPEAVTWNVHVLSARYYRAKSFKVYLVLRDNRFTMNILEGMSCFAIILPSSRLPPDDEFEYCVTVMPG